MKNTVRSVTIGILMLCAACGSSTLESPIPTDQPSAPGPPEQPPVYTPPPLTGPSRTFVFARQLEYPVRDYTVQSQIVLYDNGTFVLRYIGFDYRGVYRDADGALSISFGANVDDATGSIRGDTLTIRFSEIMQHSDFENAVYSLWR